ncbi:MAG: ACP S-malonyltransferase [Parachlamydiaceae bacterium]|nr:ACP S-malonyltransferase [Parachlamydiaceae bacterium]
MKTIMFPGQGAQYKGMGRSLFPKYRQLVKEASTVLGYCIEELCINDPENKLDQTQFTQPAIYVVNAMAYEDHIKTTQKPASFFVGHSLGEYNSLLAAQSFDFETGLKLVQEQGKIMSKVRGGGMLAVMGTRIDTIKSLLEKHHITEIDIASYNTPTQIILSGLKENIQSVERLFSAQKIQCISLNVSAPFHSRYMREAEAEFEQFLKKFNFTPPKIPVIANVTARPYKDTDVPELLARQISCSIQWTDSIRYLMSQENMTFVGMGEYPILNRMLKEIQEAK